MSELLTPTNPTVTSYFLRLALRICLLGLPATQLFAQSPEPPSDPGEVFRLTEAADLQGILTVDAGCGAALLNFPLGPGIGAPERRYAPALRGHFAPQVGLAPALPEGTEPIPALLATSAFTLSPGTLDWPITTAGSLVRWTYPDGSRGQSGGSLPEDLAADNLRIRFGYEPVGGPGQLPRPLGASPSPLPGLPGTGGEVLLTLADEVRFPRQTIPGPTTGGQPAPWVLPSGLLVVRGDQAYEYSYSETSKALGLAHYRLTAIRHRALEAVTFTYGRNGVDYQAAWKDQKVRVTLDGLAHIPPAPALDAALSILDPESPGLAFRTLVVRLRIAYEGLPSPLSYSVTALARSEFHTPQGAFAGGFHSALTPEDDLQDSFRRNLQVNSVRKDLSGEYIRFSYGPANGSFPSGTGTQTMAPIVLQELGYPGRSLHLAWEARSPVVPEGVPWSLGVVAVEDWDFTGNADKPTTHRLTFRGSVIPFADSVTYPDGSGMEFTFPGAPTPGAPAPGPGARPFRVEEQGLTLFLAPRPQAQAVAVPVPTGRAAEQPQKTTPPAARGGLKGGMLPGENPFPPGAPVRPQPPFIPPPPPFPGWPPPPPPADPYAPGPPLRPPALPPPPPIPGWPPPAPGEPAPPFKPWLPLPRHAPLPRTPGQAQPSAAWQPPQPAGGSRLGIRAGSRLTNPPRADQTSGLVNPIAPSVATPGLSHESGRPAPRAQTSQSTLPSTPSISSSPPSLFSLVNDWLERTGNQMMGLGRITGNERPIALARLEQTDPRKAEAIRFAIAAERMPVYPCDGGADVIQTLE